MEFFVNDPNVLRSAPVDVRLLDLRAEADRDKKRLRVALDLTPFQQRPNLEINLTDSEGNEAASASIIEPVGWKLELTLHIRKPDPADGKYTLAASVSYPDLGEIDRRTLVIDTSTPAQ